MRHFGTDGTRVEHLTSTIVRQSDGIGKAAGRCSAGLLSALGGVGCSWVPVELDGFRAARGRPGEGDRWTRSPSEPRNRARNSRDWRVEFTVLNGRLTTVAGWIAIVFGGVHVIIAPLERRDVWSQVIGDGWWNTFTREPVTSDDLLRSEAFWATVGSFGAPILAMGCYVVWSTRQHQRVPGWIGGMILAWGLLLVTLLPASPGWALLVIGGLIMLGDSVLVRDRADALAQQNQSRRVPSTAENSRLPRWLDSISGPAPKPWRIYRSNAKPRERTNPEK